MFQRNTVLDYPVLLIKSIGKKSFTALGKVINRSHEVVSRMLCQQDKSVTLMEQLSLEMFKLNKVLYLAIDDTLIRKFFSQNMVGSGKFYDTKLGICVTAYKLFIAAISDGKHIIPFQYRLIFAKELMKDPIESREQMIQKIILLEQETFQNKKIIILADGAFATKILLRWAFENKISVEVRMHSNRKVLYKGQQIAIRDIKNLQPRGRQMARTIQIVWHEIPLHITAQRRIDKHGVETVVFQASTYAAKPSEHVKNYKTRWPIEKTIRTCKQSLGIGDCFSTNMQVQLNHIGAVFSAFGLVQYEMKKRKLDTPEDAIRALKHKNVKFLDQYFSRLRLRF